jgi:alanine dehydrogenase
MRIGVPREIKSSALRVSVIPEVVRQLTERGHEVFVEAGAGGGVGLDDRAYALAGATLAYKGVEAALTDDAGFAAGLNIRAGVVTHAEVQRSLPLH